MAFLLVYKFLSGWVSEHLLSAVVLAPRSALNIMQCGGGRMHSNNQTISYAANTITAHVMFLSRSLRCFLSLSVRDASFSGIGKTVETPGT